MDRLANCKKFLKVDRKMLPIKLHFFLYALAVSAVMSYFTIITKNIGISATATGIIYTISPFVTVLANPLFGWITDKLQQVKLVIIVLVIVQTPMFIGTVFVPSLQTEHELFPVELSCLSNNTHVIISPKFITSNFNKTSMKCNSNCTAYLQLEITSDDKLSFVNSIKFEIENFLNSSSNILKVSNISVNGTQFSPNCHQNIINKCQTACTFHVGDDNVQTNEFATYQFWIILFLIVFCIMFVNASIALGDAACYEALEGKVNQFGKQRVCLTIGWGLNTMLTGYFLDLTNPNKEEKTNFAYCAYIMLVLVILDIIALSQAKLTKSGVSRHILKDVGKIFARPHPIFFANAILIIGALSSIQWNFQFWFLEDIGASKLLLGLSTAVVCIAAEAPFMFISGWVVKRIGRDNSITLAISSLGFWCLCISFIHNPWWVLLIDLSQGPSYGLFFFAMSSYGKIATAPGTEATMQTVLGAIFHGLGIGSGSLLGGLGFDLYGGRITFRFAGFFGMGAAIIYKLLTTFVAGEHSALYKGETTELTEPVPDETDKKTPKHEIYSVS